MSLQALRIRHVGPLVQIVAGDKLVFEAPPHVMREIIGVMQQVTGLAEEIEQRERIVFDNAILLRTGALPLGLIHNPYLLHQSGIEAAWNSALRRYIPGGVKSKEAFGVPTIINESDLNHDAPRD